MKKIFLVILILLSAVMLVSCQRNMTAQIQEQLALQDARVRLTVGHFSDSCAVTCREGEYVFSDFSRSGLHDLTVRLGDGSVQHTLSDLSLSPISEGVEGFLQLYRLLFFLGSRNISTVTPNKTGSFAFSSRSRERMPQSE